VLDLIAAIRFLAAAFIDGVTFIQVEQSARGYGDDELVIKVGWHCENSHLIVVQVLGISRHGGTKES
jgi:hypothetical protein